MRKTEGDSTAGEADPKAASAEKRWSRPSGKDSRSKGKITDAKVLCLNQVERDKGSDVDGTHRSAARTSFLRFPPFVPIHSV